MTNTRLLSTLTALQLFLGCSQDTDGDSDAATANTPTLADVGHGPVVADWVNGSLSYVDCKAPGAGLLLGIGNILTGPGALLMLDVASG